MPANGSPVTYEPVFSQTHMDPQQATKSRKPTPHAGTRAWRQWQKDQKKKK